MAVWLKFAALTSLTLKELGKIIFYLVATVILGALLAPPLSWGLQWLNSLGYLLNLAETPFQRVFNRGIMVAAILLIYPVARWIQLPKGFNLAAFGLKPNPRRWQDLGVGFLGSFLVMVLLAAAVLYLEIYTFRKEVRWDGLQKVASSAVFVSLIEEGLFRGVLFALLLRTLHPFFALFSVSAIYSIVHFVKPKGHLVMGSEIEWTSGFPLLLDALRNFHFQSWFEFLTMLGGFATLFCVGWIMGWTRLKTGSLWMAIGLHAGWILGKMGLGPIAKRKIKDDVTLPWLGEDITVGLVSIAVVLLTGVLIWLWITRVRNKHHEPDEPAVAPAKLV
jgi:membrane protease YdiL (CAAX protease family)